MVKSVDPALDTEALRVINGMPNWTPGRQNGKVVNVKYTIPISFRLQAKKAPKSEISSPDKLKKVTDVKTIQSNTDDMTIMTKEK